MSSIQEGNWVVSTNPLHAGNGVGIVQQVRGEQAKVEFRPTVFSKPPYLTESRILNVNELCAVKSPLECVRDGEDVFCLNALRVEVT